MINTGEIPPNTFSASPIDEFDRIQLIGDLNRRRRERSQQEAADIALTQMRIEAHSESDEIHAEGDQ